MDLRSCTNNAMNVSQTLPGLELSRECLIMSDGQALKLQSVIFDFRFRFYLNL